MLEILGKTSIDFMGLRRYSFALSGVLVFVGLIALFQIWRGAANLGIDFAGGTAVQLKFDQPIPIEQARQALVHHGFGEVEIQDITLGNKLLIRVKAQTTIEEKVAEKVLETEITLLLVTALLTLAGYSLTDTVVVFDRIRENLKMRHRDPLATVINNAVNQVLSRTVVVSLTVILVLIPLTLAGGEVLHDFSLALLLGVIVGTYSSVFVASPLLILWKGTPGKLLRRS